MPGKCAFQEQWFELDCGKRWKLWLRPVNRDKHKAFCVVCKSEFDIGYTGITSVKSHEKGKKHSQLIETLESGKQTTLNFNLKANLTLSADHKVDIAENKSSSTSTPGMSNELVQKTSSAATLTTYFLHDDVTKAEILWSINKVVNHSSDRSSSNAADLFPIMFPDSLIAQKFQMHKDKLAYFITYGLGPYFQNILAENVKKCTCFAVSFDESLNKVAQKGQMDLVVRYWDIENNNVSTRYLTSVFLTHSTARDLLDGFTNGLISLGLSLNNIIQVSMDGPNVNIKFLRDLKQVLKDNMEDVDYKEIFDVGTCSLHIVHGAYKTAHNKIGWLINDFLRALFYLFKDFPSRRADYLLYSGSSKFPLKFCAIRWVENSKVIQRALEIVSPLKKYVDAVQKNPPATKNFDKVKNILSDKLLPAKLEFMLSVSLELESFLTNFQSNNSLLPFMHKELYILLKSLAERFVQRPVMDAIHNSSKLMALDVSNSHNLKSPRDVGVGFGATSALKGLKELDVISFKIDCRQFLVFLFTKLIQKCPLRNKIVRGASCLSPEVMLCDTLRNLRVHTALEEFVTKNRITASVADCVKRDYLRLCETPSVKDALKKFDWKQERLDEFLMKILEEANMVNKNLVEFFQQLLIMFHGNAAVERGFSINKECLLVNLMEESLIAQRAVYSAVVPGCKLANLTISKAMIQAARNASSKRKEALRTKKENEAEGKNVLKRMSQELKTLEMKKKRVNEEKDEVLEIINTEILSLKNKLKKC